MAGHSKWKQIKRQKGANDAKRGQVFTKLAREIIVAVKAGGPNPEANNRLRLAIQSARSLNMPNDNVERAIKKATSAEEQGSNYEDIYYEAYGPHGIALMLHALTDNRNRTVSEVRAVLTRGGARLGEAGSVAYLFDQLGVVRARLDGTDADEASLVAIDAGATDVRVDADEGTLEIYTEVGGLRAVQEAMEGLKLEVETAEISMVPKTTVSLEASEVAQLLRLIERLEDLEDIQEVYSNLEVSAAVLEQVAAGA
jgi:YebC/PmpR family DNA-binding regulatory protein